MGSLRTINIAEQYRELLEHREHYLADNAALRSRLESKVKAVTILNKELDKCRSERDQFKLMAEQLQDRCTRLKKKSYDGVGYNEERIDYSQVPGANVAKLLQDTRELNKELTLQIESLRQKLSEAEGDIKVLRQQSHNFRSNNNNYSESQIFPVHQREELVKQLEKSNLKITQLQSDLQAMLDEKEELIKERDAFKCKVHRLNHELGVLLKAEQGPLLDGDALITENRYLHERLQQAEAETLLATQALAKYKSMLETKRRKGIIKFGTNNSEMIMSHKQVKKLLEEGTSAELPVTAATIADMKSLCSGLLEALNDKSLALSHQRKANRILASRITDLEQKFENGKKMSVFPSQILLENYCSADVDRAEIDISDINTITEDNTPTDDVIKIDNNKIDEKKDDENKDVKNKTELNDMALPPQLQMLVDKAMEELENESN